jgi:hypothetical protein
MVRDLQKKMLSLGYLQYQIDGITFDTIGQTSIHTLDKGKAERLIATYNRCIDFIHKCQKYAKR